VPIGLQSGLHSGLRLPRWVRPLALVFAAVVSASGQSVAYIPAAAVAGTLTPDPIILTPAPAPLPKPVLNQQRIMGVLPDYQTVRDTTVPVAPLTHKEKWLLMEQETIDPVNIASAFVGAAQSQRGNQTPSYGEGYANFGRRFGAALADCGTQNFFSAGVLANVLHQDPRYFRKGPQSRILPRIAYSLSRLVIARQDSGRASFNASGIGGMMMGIAASNLYYPAASVSGSVMAGRISTSMMGGAIGNLMSEFWPDLQQKFFKKHFK